MSEPPTVSIAWRKPSPTRSARSAACRGCCTTCRYPRPRQPVVTELRTTGLNADARVIMEKPFGTDLASARALNATLLTALRRIPDLPDRPLPRQGGGPEHPRAAVRERAVRAGLEPQPHRPRPDRRSRDTLDRHARRVLRRHGRLSRHGGDTPLPGARLRRDGAAHVARGEDPRRREDQGLRRDAAASTFGRGPGSVRGLPRRGGRATRFGDRDVRRGAGPGGQLALGRGSLLPADRKASRREPPGPHARVQPAAATHVPARRATSRPSRSDATTSRSSSATPAASR